MEIGKIGKGGDDMDISFLMEYMDKGILLVIAWMFFSNYKEDRQNYKEDRAAQKILVEASQEQTRELINVVSTNTAVFEDARQMHEVMDGTLIDIKKDIEFLKSVVGPVDNSDILEALNRIESKVENLGKEPPQEG